MNLQSAFLEVVIPPDIISEETSNDLMVPEGAAAKLVCKARGYPKPEITWRREDGAVIISRDGLSGGKTKRKYRLYNYDIYHLRGYRNIQKNIKLRYYKRKILKSTVFHDQQLKSKNVDLWENRVFSKILCIIFISILKQC